MASQIGAATPGVANRRLTCQAAAAAAGRRARRCAIERQNAKVRADDAIWRSNSSASGSSGSSGSGRGSTRWKMKMLSRAPAPAGDSQLKGRRPLGSMVW